MTLRKFVIGQAVDFDRRFPSMSRPTGPFEILSAFPIGEDNSPTYRVKSNAEPFARAPLTVITHCPSLPTGSKLGQFLRGPIRSGWETLLTSLLPKAGFI